MNKPNFVCDGYNVSPEFPSNWSVKPLRGENIQTTLDGTERTDVLYRKKQYVLEYDAMSIDDYVALEELIDYAYDNGLSVTFTYGKWTATSTGILCNVRLSDRQNAGGSGNTMYFSKVTVTITQISSDI